MAITRTSLLDLPIITTGTESGTWGDITNNGLTQYLDIAIAGMTSLTSANFTAGALTINTTEGDSSATNIAAGSAQYATIKVSSLAANSTITAPASNRSYRIVNADSTYSLTIKASGQTGVTFLPGQTGVVAFTGTDYEYVGVVNAASSTDNAIARFDSTTGNVLQNSGVTIDDSGNLIAVAGTNSAPAITTTGDTNTGIFFPAADTIALATNGVERAKVGNSETVFNDGGANVDFRVEGDTEPNLLFVDASTDNIGMGTNSITTFGTAYRTLQLQASSGTGDGSAIRFMYDGGTANTNDLVVYNNSSGGNIRQNGALTLNFLVNGSERMRIDSSGNVGIGTDSPNSLLEIKAGAQNTPNFRIYSAYNSASSTYGIDFYRDTDAGANKAVAYVKASRTGGSVTDLVFGTSTVPDTVTERARITSGGQMSLISTVDGLHVGSTQASGTSYWLFRGASAATAGTANSGTDRFFVFTNGNVTNSNGSYGTISDAKLKQDIIDAGSQWADIKNLRFRKYRMKSDVAENPNAPYLLGFVAQELETISPGLIEEHPDTTIETKTREVEKTREIPAVLNEDGNEVEPARTETYTETEEYTETVDLGTTTKSIKTSILYMKAVKALQEAMERIETLEASNTALEARIAALEQA